MEPTSRRGHRFESQVFKEVLNRPRPPRKWAWPAPALPMPENPKLLSMGLCSSIDAPMTRETASAVVGCGGRIQNTMGASAPVLQAQAKTPTTRKKGNFPQQDMALPVHLCVVEVECECLGPFLLFVSFLDPRPVFQASNGENHHLKRQKRAPPQCNM